jgi:hypothetical protein
MESLKPTKIVFLSEQDGPVERQLKQRFILHFSRGIEVSLAYLARVSYNDAANPFVAVCVLADRSKSREIATDIGEIFRKLFNISQSLDIFFLSETQVLEIDRVARPFYPPLTSPSA